MVISVNRPTPPRIHHLQIHPPQILIPQKMRKRQTTQIWEIIKQEQKRWTAAKDSRQGLKERRRESVEKERREGGKKAKLGEKRREGKEKHGQQVAQRRTTAIPERNLSKLLRSLRLPGKSRCCAT